MERIFACQFAYGAPTSPEHALQLAKTCANNVVYASDRHSDLEGNWMAATFEMDAFRKCHRHFYQEMNMQSDHPCMQYLATEAAAMQQESERTWEIASEAGAEKVMWERALDEYTEYAMSSVPEMRTERDELRAALVKAEHEQSEQERLRLERRREHMHCEVEVLRRILAKAEQVEGNAEARELMSAEFLTRRGLFEKVD